MLKMIEKWFAPVDETDMKYYNLHKILSEVIDNVEGIRVSFVRELDRYNHKRAGYKFNYNNHEFFICIPSTKPFDISFSGNIMCVNVCVKFIIDEEPTTISRSIQYRTEYDEYRYAKNCFGDCSLLFDLLDERYNS